jgi:hypothetical protein
MKTITLEQQKKIWNCAYEVEFEGKKYICEGQAEATNRLLDTFPNYNNTDEAGHYDYEIADSAIDVNGNNYSVYWIVNTNSDWDYIDWDYVNRVVLRD